MENNEDNMQRNNDWMDVESWWQRQELLVPSSEVLKFRERAYAELGLSIDMDAYTYEVIEACHSALEEHGLCIPAGSGGWLVSATADTEEFYAAVRQGMANWWSKNMVRCASHVKKYDAIYCTDCDVNATMCADGDIVCSCSVVSDPATDTLPAAWNTTRENVSRMAIWWSGKLERVMPDAS